MVDGGCAQASSTLHATIVMLNHIHGIINSVGVVFKTAPREMFKLRGRD